MSLVVQGTDTINFSNSSVIHMPLFSRPRPEGMSSLPAQRSSGSVGLASSNSSSYARLMHSTYKQLPNATFLTHIPKVPRALRVDCGQTCAKQFLTKSPPSERLHQTRGKFSSTHSLPSYNAHRSNVNGSEQNSNLRSSSTAVSFINFSSNSLKSLSNLGKLLNPTPHSMQLNSERNNNCTLSVCQSVLLYILLGSFAHFPC